MYMYFLICRDSGEGELYPLGNGNTAGQTAMSYKMIPEGLGDIGFTYETCQRFLKENGVEKAVILQGSYYGFANEYVAEAVKHIRRCLSEPDFRSDDPICGKIYDRLDTGIRISDHKVWRQVRGGFMSHHHTFDIEEVFTPFAKKCEKHPQVQFVLDIGSPG